MLGHIHDEEEEKKKKRKVGRPPRFDEEKKLRNMRLTDTVWNDLYTIGGGNRTAAIEELVYEHWEMLREKLGKKDKK